MPKYHASSVGLLERLPLHRDQAWVGYAVAAVITFIAWGGRTLLLGVLPPGYPFLTYFPGVIITAFFFGRASGVTAGILGGLCAVYFFLPPFHSFTLTHESTLPLVFFALVVALCIYLITLLQRAAHALVRERDANLRLAETRRLLFHELQHRVSNNLQVVGALLSAQKRRVSEEAARTALDEAANRLTVIGRISRELYRADGGRAELAEFLPHLADAVLEAAGRNDIDCRFSLPSGLLLDPDRAIPLALVFTEAMANAIEHGYPDGSGAVHVAVVRTDTQHLTLTVTDDGLGIPPDFDLERADSVGLRIASQLARQLGGHFSLGPTPAGTGARARLEIPAA
jgi:two-component sensor histidine kinase